MKTQLRSLILFGTTLVFITGCGKEEDSLCGAKTYWSGYVQDDYIYNDLDLLTGRRTLLYEDLTTPENICTDEHTSALFLVSLDSFPPSGMNLYGKAYWSLYEREVELFWNPNKLIYEGTLSDIGLKQAFGTDPGWIGLQVKFVFPTQGSFTADTTLIRSYIDTMGIRYDYYEDL